MKKIVAVANQKGGVGKTTTVVNLAANLIRNGFKVLCIDLDGQGNLSDYLGYAGDEETPVITDLIKAEMTKDITEDMITNAILTSASDGIDYIPSDISLSMADMFMASAIGREMILRRLLEKAVFDKYDYIIIDCLPSLGILVVNALVAATGVLIPVQTQKFALNGIVQFEEIITIDAWESELKNDLPSFIKTAFAWDELRGYGSIEEEIDYGEHPAKVVRDFFKKESGSTYICDGEYTDCEWTLTECDGKPVINISILRDGEHKPFCSFDKEFSWDDISNAVVNRIKQESVYQKIISNCYRFTKNNENNYTVYDPEEGKTIVSGSDIQLKECFKKLLNKREAEMIIQNEVVPSLAQADEQYENSQENDDMEI